jgi:phosphatidyl-myo-inositol dimannoside synthase
MDSIHLVLPELSSDGGVQRYCRQLSRAVQIVARDEGLGVETFNLNDPGTSVEIHGFDRDKRALASALFRAGRRDRPRAVLYGHTNLAPLVMGYRVISPKTRHYVIAHGVEVEVGLDKPTLAGLFAATRVLGVSTWTRSLLVSRHHLPARKAGILRYGFSEEVEPQEPVADRAENGHMHLLSVSRLSRSDAYKGIDVTIEALGLLKDELPNLQYVVVGDGDDRGRLERLAEENGVRDRVHLRGRISDEQLHAEYRRCDVFVLPSTHEGLGIVYLEAMAHAKPVIGAHAGGVADAVVHEMNGLLVERSDPGHVAGAIRRVMTDRALRTRLGRWGHEFTLPRFSFAQMVHDVRAFVLDF